MPTEDVEIVLVPITEVSLKIANREIRVAGSIAAIFLGLDLLKKQQLGLIVRTSVQWY